MVSSLLPSISVALHQCTRVPTGSICRSILNSNPSSLGSSAGVLGAAINVVQIREFSRVKQRHTHPFYWWSKKRRERNDQELTTENEAFINKVIFDKYGPLQLPESGKPYVSPLKQVVHERGEWQPWSIRSGVIARKIGIYPMWETDGTRILTTLLQVIDNHVIKYIPPDVVKQSVINKYKRDDVGLLLVGAESTDPQRFQKEYLGLFEETGLPPKNILRRFMITDNAKLQPGTPLYATHFMVGQKVDVYGKTINRGFQGVMKRWGFKGLPATHGVTKSHRRGGNIGGGGEKGRVWPGTKMPGKMGDRWRKHMAAEIVRINTKYNVIYIRGCAVPGAVGSICTIQDTFCRSDEFDRSKLPFPTHYPEESREPIPDEYYGEEIFDFGNPTILFEEKR